MCFPIVCTIFFFFFFSSRRRHTRSLCDWSSDVCSSDLKPAVRVGLVGKYVKSPDAYISIVEALRHAGLLHGVDIELRRINSEELESETNIGSLLGDLDRKSVV